MKFGQIPTLDAAGAILAHSQKLPGGRVLKKGHVLTGSDLDDLLAAGRVEVIVALPAPDDIGEDMVAAAIAAALCGDGLRCAAPFTGRCNLVAGAAGLVHFTPATIHALNQVDEAITLATLPPFARVAAGDLVATVKVIPFAVPRATVEAAMHSIGPAPVIRLAPFRPLRAALIQTTLPGLKPSILAGTVTVTAERLSGLGATLAASSDCPHEQDALAADLRRLAPTVDLILITGASALTDRRDVIPAAIEAAGGSVEAVGMPVDPGNLLLIGKLGGRPVLGLPGCARSPKLNGFDWVLERLVAGLPVGRAEIAQMGVGGLLKEIPTRPQPRGSANTPRAPRIAGVLLAAGRSSRMTQDGRSGNKLLLPWHGRPMVRAAAEALLASQIDSLTVVIGHEGEAVRAALDGLPLRIVENPDYAAGMSTSLKTGIMAAGTGADGVLIALGDMPLLAPATIDRLIAAFNPAEGRAICQPIVNGQPGNPVLWDAALLPEFAGLGGDMGARPLLARHADRLCQVPVEDQAILIDIDTAEAYAAHHGN